MTIAAADRMFSTIKDWEYKIISFDNQLIIGDSPVLVMSKSERQDISEIQIDSDVLNSNIIIEDLLTKRRKVYINNAVKIISMSFPEESSIYMPLSPKFGMFLFSNNPAKNMLECSIEKMTELDINLHDNLNMFSYMHCNDYIMGHNIELLNKASEYIRVSGYTQKFSTKGRK